jgi:hypothetical protein
VVGIHRTWATTNWTTVLLSGAFGIGVIVGTGAGEAEADLDSAGDGFTSTAAADGDAEALELGAAAALHALSATSAVVSARAGRNANPVRLCAAVAVISSP